MSGAPVIRSMTAAVLLLAAACSKGEGPQVENTPGGPGQGPQEEQAVPVEKLYIELNGQTYCAFAGGGGVLLEPQGQDEPQEQNVTAPSGTQDTIRLQEEGLRCLKITGYEPENARPPLIDSIEFHHDIYTFTFNKDSITVLGGSYALPDNWYLSPVGEGLLAFKGRSIMEAGEARFYNYSNRSYDYATVEVDGEMVNIPWLELGKPRGFRVVFTLGQKGENRFELPFYELPNRVEILTGEGQDAQGPQKNSIKVSPGDTLQLRYAAAAPEEFNVFEWCLGTATERYSPLNAAAVEGDYLREVANPLLTEDAVRYTLSKVHLSREGFLVVDADWDAENARLRGGGVFNEVPVCVIGMPAGNPLVEAMDRSFTFPTGERRSFPPTPFYSNATVRIAE